MKKGIEYSDGLAVKTELLNIRHVPKHNHDDFQIIYVLEGELSLTLFYARYRLQPGSIHIIHSEDVHSMESITENNRVLVLSLDCEYFKSIFPHFITTVFITNIGEGSFEKKDALSDLIFSIVSEEYHKTPGYVSRINNAGVSLINILIKNFRGFVIDPSEKAFIHKTSRDYMQVDRISRIISYLYEHYPYKLSLAEIAERESISPYYLSHVFHKIVGMNFRDFLNMVRVEMSETEILATDKSITQIALDVGFSDAKYYIAHFYKYMGCHPKEYRKKHADQIYGVIMPDVEEYPVSMLKPVISQYTQYPVFRDAAQTFIHVQLDFSGKSAKKTPANDSALVFCETMGPMFSGLGKEASKLEAIIHLYQSNHPQAHAVQLLSRWAEKPESFHPTQITPLRIADTIEHADGLLAINGLKKPIFYLLELLRDLPNEIAAHGSNYIALQGDDSKYLVIWNPKPSAGITMDIVAENVNANYKLTKYKLQAENTCIDYWAQLNFSGNLDASDIRNIDRMTSPNIEFEIVPRWEQYFTSMELAPLDIALLEFFRE